MKASPHSPAEIFGNQLRYVIPLFQRPYVWNKDEQWAPLWADVGALADAIIEAGPVAFGSTPVPPHFLGAIVVEQQLAPVAHIAVRHVIDGQQRLTTLQLLLDAAQWVVENHGQTMDSQALRVLVQNTKELSPDPDHVFKVWPTDRDQAAFRAAMNNDTVVSPDLAGSRIAQAHAFFIEAITEWAEISGDPDKVVDRLAALTRALRDHIRLVVIDLEPGDNAQVIFETLNHRGTPLLAADLVKNLVFQLASAQNLDVEKLYRAHWVDLDSDYWRQPVAQGRLFRPRIDVFLNRWLVMKLLREVPADRVFADFRDHVVAGESIDNLLAELAADAAVHRQMEQLDPGTAEGRFYYRVLRAMDTQVVGPFLMWILRHHEGSMPLEQRRRALMALESWLVRRALCRLTTKDHNRMVLELLRAVVESGPEVVGDTTETILGSQTAGSRFWPDDDAVAKSLRSEAVYKNLVRSRVRMILEALEDDLRGPLGEGQPCPYNLTIEHVMPQAWREHWGGDVVGDLAAEMRRDALVHTIGNLTLVNGKLNPTMSNRPWSGAEAEARGLGDQGKYDHLLANSELKLNSKLVAGHPYSWTEADIEARTNALITALCRIWPRAASAASTPVSEGAGDEDVEVSELPTDTESSSKYAALGSWLTRQAEDEVRLTFTQIEEIIGRPLPASSRKYHPHWRSYEGSAVVRAIQDAGWRTASVDLPGERVVLERFGDRGAGISSGDSSEPADVLRKFEGAMKDVYRRAKEEAGYNATYFLAMLAELGSLATARRLLATPGVSEGFVALWERNRLDLTVENVVLRPEFASLFTEEERELAGARLAEYGFDAG